MSNPYAVLGEHDEPAAEVLDLPWVRYARWTLWAVAVGYLLLGLGVAAAMGVALVLEPPGPGDTEAVIGVGAFVVIMSVVSVAVAALNFAAAWGLARRAMWAWGLTLGLGGLYLASICFPFGAVLLYGMLENRTRKAFLGK